MPYAAKAKTQQFTRRKSNLANNADQLARMYNADLALIIRKEWEVLYGIAKSKDDGKRLIYFTLIPKLWAGLDHRSSAVDDVIVDMNSIHFYRPLTKAGLPAWRWAAHSIKP